MFVEPKSFRKGATQEEALESLNLPPPPPDPTPMQAARYAAGVSNAGVAESARLQRMDPNMFAMGGNGAVARGTPETRQTNIAGGLTRDEIIRRMEMASSSMRGSPGARNALMGAYADQLKALDQGELAKNQGNIDAGQLAFKTNMDANMQESRGRQEFGNTMGALNRKGVLDMQVAEAGKDPTKNYWANLKTQAEIAKLKSDTARVNDVYDIERTSKADTAIGVRAKQLTDAGMDPAQALQQAGLEALGRGDPNSSQARGVLDNSGRTLADALTNRSWGGIWADNDDTQPGFAPGTVLDPTRVAFDTSGGSGNLYNDWIASWMPFTEKDQRLIYTDPITGKQNERWLDLSETEDKQLYDMFSMFSNNPNLQKLQRKQP